MENREFEKIYHRILDNKNDLIENTFFYKLHEEETFDFTKLKKLVNDIEQYAKILEKNEENKINEKTLQRIISVLLWIQSSTYKLIIYHKDKNDLFNIKQYVNGSEEDIINAIDLLNESINKLCNNIIFIKKY